MCSQEGEVVDRLVVPGVVAYYCGRVNELLGDVTVSAIEVYMRAIDPDVIVLVGYSGISLSSACSTCKNVFRDMCMYVIVGSVR